MTTRTTIVTVVHIDIVHGVAGNRSTLSYASDMVQPYPATVRDDAGRTLIFTYEPAAVGTGTTPAHSQRLVSVAGPNGTRLSFAYADNDYLSDVQRMDNDISVRHERFVYRSNPANLYTTQPIEQVQDAISGATWHYGYDALTVSVQVSDGQTTQTGQPISFLGYDVNHVTAPDGGETTLTYSGAIGTGQPLPRTVTDGLGHVTSYGLNAYGAPLTVTDATGTTTLAWHDVHIEPIARTDKNGTTTITTYDTYGNTTSETITGADGIVARAWTYAAPSAFAKPFIKNRAQTAIDARGITTSYSYDGNGNRTGTTRGGVSTTDSYAPNGDHSGSSNGRGQATIYHYDAFGYPHDALDGLGVLGGSTYDALGRKTTERDGNGALTSYSYDALDRVIALQMPPTAAGSGSQAIAYDDVAHTRTQTDENGHVSVTTYDLMGRTVGVKHADGASATTQYDTNGNTIASTDFNGNVTSFVYDAANRLTDRHAPEGRDTHIDYDAMGHVTRETVGAGADQRIAEYDYKTPEYHRTHERHQADSGWAETLTAYDGNGNATQTTDALGRVSQRTFDARDRVIELDEPQGKVTTYAYDADDDRTGEILNLAPARTRTWTYDARKRETARTDGTDGVWSTGYDLANQVTARHDPLQHGTTTTYDARHRLSTQAGPEAGMTTSYAYDLVGNRTQETWANGEIIDHVYDALNRPTSSTDALGTLSTKTYDANGNVLTETDANGNVSTHHYDGLNRRVKSDLPEQRTLQWSYDFHGEVTLETDALGHSAMHHYDRLGRRTGIDTELTTQSWSYDLAGNRTAQVDANGNETDFVYDDLNRKKSQADVALGYSQAWTYDVAGNVLSQTDRRGTTSAWTYDAEGRITQSQRAGIVLAQNTYDLAGNLTTLTDANGHATSYVYDKANRRTREQRPLNATIITAYDPIGDVYSVTDADGDTQTSTYDVRRRLASEANGAGETTTYTIDGNGNRIGKTRPLAQAGNASAWSYSYDGANRLIEVDDPLAHATHYGYDKNGNRTAQTDANQHVTTFNYDALNRRTGKTYPSGIAIESTTPDGNGNVLSRTDPNGQTITTIYDALNRATQRSYGAATASDIGSENFSYDGNGNLTTITQHSATATFTTTRSYDVFDRLASETDRYGSQLQFVYDLNGNRLSRIDTAGTTSTVPDALNRIVQVTPPNGGTTQTVYTPAGRVQSVTTPSGLTSVTSYDQAGRIVTLTHKQNAAPVASYAYQYDANGNRIEQDEINGGNAEVTTYGYDDADRLIDVAYPNLVAHYDLDSVGNRTQETQTDPTSHAQIKQVTATFNARDQLTNLADTTAAMITYIYDLNGNLSTKSQSGQVTNYRNNAQDRLATLSLQGAPPSQASSYDYDADGMRVAKIANGQTTHYRYDQQALIQETNTLGNLLARYDYSADRQLSEVRNTLTNYFLHDALKSPIAQVTSQGAIAMRAQYDAWGLLRNESGTNTQAFGFTGYQRDRESGLYYAKARYYDPTTARFNSEDPEEGKAQTPPSLHRYLYAYANPTVYTDPNGREVWTYETYLLNAMSAEHDPVKYDQLRNEYATASVRTGARSVATMEAARDMAVGFYQLGKTLLKADYEASLPGLAMGTGTENLDALRGASDRIATTIAHPIDNIVTPIRNGYAQAETLDEKGQIYNAEYTRHKATLATEDAILTAVSVASMGRSVASNIGKALRKVGAEATVVTEAADGAAGVKSLVPNTTTPLSYDISNWGESGLPSDGRFVRTLTPQQYRDFAGGRGFNFGGKLVDGFPEGMGFIGAAEEVSSIDTAAGYQEALKLNYEPKYLFEFQLKDPAGLQNVLSAPYDEFVPGGLSGSGYKEFNYPGISSDDIVNPEVRVLK